MKIQNRVCTSARLPFEITIGTEKHRFKLANYNMQKFYNLLKKNNDGKTCTVEDFSRCLSASLNRQNCISFTIKPLGENDRGASLTRKIFVNYNGQNYDVLISGYKLNLPLDKSGKIIQNKYYALHEASHLFDHIYNPKTIPMRVFNGFEDKEYSKAHYNMTNLFLKDINKHTNMQTIRQKTQEYLSQIPDEQAIDILQTIRQTLKTEIKAYNNEIKFMLSDSLLNIFDVIKIKTSILNRAKFKPKLKFVNSLLKEKLTNVRNKNKVLYPIKKTSA